jgi:predicted GNAT superfamily acetyltransferase
MKLDLRIRIESLSTREQYEACVDVQNAVWGYSPTELFPARAFLMARVLGGQVLGAYDGERLAGFAMALPAVRDGQPYLHSQMLAVLPGYRDSGVGQRLKWAQRDEALSRGIERMEWTFDPLEIKNARLNIAKLGAVCRRYAPDFYGPSSSPLQGGLPTDRLYAEWWLDSERVARAQQGTPQPSFAIVEEIVVPGEIAVWKTDASERSKAVAIQAHNRDAFIAAFARGLAVLGYGRSATGDGIFELGRWEESLF